MPLTIGDEALRAMRMNEQEARVEIACRLFDAGVMSFGHAAALAELTEAQMLDEIERRGIPRYRYTAEHLRQDLEGIRRLEEEGNKAQAGTR
jgi:predicted HTH domain antitoxin